MINLKIETNEKQMKDIVWQLRKIPEKIPIISARVANRVVSTIRKEISKTTMKEYVVKSKIIKDTMSFYKANSQQPNAKVKLSGNRIELYQFKVSPNIPRTEKPPKAYKAKVKKNGGFKKIYHAFVADIGGMGMHERETKSKFPTKRLYGPSVPEMVGNEKVSGEILKAGQETFNKRLVHEIEYELEKLK